MVSSGLSERVSVAPERLMIHLGSLALFVVLIWTALDAWSGSPRVMERLGLARLGPGLPGGGVLPEPAGRLGGRNDAGLVYNDWPLMNGHLFPAEYLGKGLGARWPTARGRCRWHHRLVAYLLFAAGSPSAFWRAATGRWRPARRARRWRRRSPSPCRRAWESGP
ncbi:COX15/CtaA family protein [Caulobacter segnis]